MSGAYPGHIRLFAATGRDVGGGLLLIPIIATGMVQAGELMTITNTLETARRLETMGFPHEQAQGLADILEETARAARPDLSQLATKADLDALASRLETKLNALETNFEKALRQQMLWFLAMLVAVFGAAFTLARFISVP